MAAESKAERIHRLLAAADEAESVRVFCEEQGLDERRFREWRRRYGSMSVQDIARERRRFLPVIGVVLVAVVALAIWQWPNLQPLIERAIVGTGALAVTTEPPGAEVTIGGRVVGHSPTVIESLVAGEHFLQVEHPYREKRELVVDIKRNETREEYLELAAAVGELRLISNPKGAWVELNGERLEGVTPIKLVDFPAGEHRVRMGMEERRSALQTVELRASQQAELLVELNKIPMGSLRVDVDPGDAKVRLIDIDQPYVAGMRLAVGTYPIEVTRAGYRTAQAQANVRFEQEARVAVALERTFGVLAVTVVPSSADVTVIRGSERQRYQRGMKLPTGTVTVEARAMGYRSHAERVRVGIGGGAATIRLAKINAQPGRVINDALTGSGQAPSVVVIAAGTFQMGDDDGSYAERPSHPVRVLEPFAIGTHEVSRRQYQRFLSATGKAQRWPDGDAELPATGLDFDEVTAYLAWLSRQSGERFRLPSEAEWEFAARAGSTGRMFFGTDPEQLCRYGNVADAAANRVFREWDTLACDDGQVRLAPVGRYQPNGNGLFDVYGNAAEWVSDCWHDDYEGAPRDGSAWGRGPCSRVARGGSWDSRADSANSVSRAPARRRADDRGFRVVREL